LRAALAYFFCVVAECCSLLQVAISLLLTLANTPQGAAALATNDVIRTLTASVLEHTRSEVGAGGNDADSTMENIDFTPLADAVAGSAVPSNQFAGPFAYYTVCRYWVRSFISWK
jgi:hypothetical protein